MTSVLDPIQRTEVQPVAGPSSRDESRLKLLDELQAVQARYRTARKAEQDGVRSLGFARSRLAQAEQAYRDVKQRLEEAEYRDGRAKRSAHDAARDIRDARGRNERVDRLEPHLRRTELEVRRHGAVNGGEIMYRQGGSRAEMWRLKSVPPVAFNQERPNLTEGGLDVQGGYLPPCSQGLFRRRDERPRGGPSVRATPGHGAQDARVLRAPRVSTATTGSQTEARSI